METLNSSPQNNRNTLGANPVFRTPGLGKKTFLSLETENW